MKKSLVVFIAATSLIFSLASTLPFSKKALLSPLASKKTSSSKECLPHLAKYSFNRLAKRQYYPSTIKLERVIKKEKDYTSWLFSYRSDGKRVTGMANIPKRKGRLPVIVMIRGYVDKQIYFTGLGTRKAAGFFAQNGFLTLAPDFLGFGGSDQESPDILEARFTRPITILNLLASIKTLSQADPKRIFLWGHSNGGQIALSVLEISQKDYPTTLWAPVTKPFPQSILQYIDFENITPESQKVIDAISQFEKCHDPKLYSITTFLDKIKAPLQIHQGGKDAWVKYQDQEIFVQKLKAAQRKINYYFYPDADHNLKQNWDTVVQKDLEFFKSFSKTTN